jgi:hypothetical protein
MSALDELKEKGVDETTSLEHAVLILYLSEETHGKPLANEAAEELAAMQEAIEAAREALRLAQNWAMDRNEHCYCGAEFGELHKPNCSYLELLREVNAALAKIGGLT